MERSAARPAATKAQEPLKKSEDLANMRAATCMTCFVHDSHNDIQDRRGQDVGPDTTCAITTNQKKVIRTLDIPEPNPSLMSHVQWNLVT